MCEPQCQGIVEGVGNAVNEAAHNEKRYAKEQWQPHLLSGKVHYGGHNESAEYSEKGNVPESFLKPAVDYALSSAGEIGDC